MQHRFDFNWIATWTNARNVEHVVGVVECLFAWFMRRDKCSHKKCHTQIISISVKWSDLLSEKVEKHSKRQTFSTFWCIADIVCRDSATCEKDMGKILTGGFLIWEKMHSICFNTTIRCSNQSSQQRRIFESVKYRKIGEKLRRIYLIFLREILQNGGVRVMKGVTGKCDGRHCKILNWFESIINWRQIDFV